MSTLSESSEKWYAVYTRSRQEKKVTERLQNQGIKVYCPMYITVKQWSDRKKKVQLPAIPSYVFVCIDYERDRNKILYDQGVIQFVFWQSKPAIIREKEIQSLQYFMNEYGSNIIEFDTISVGQEITLSEGVFKGNVGEVIEVSNTKAILLMKSLGFKLTVNL